MGNKTVGSSSVFGWNYLYSLKPWEKNESISTPSSKGLNCCTDWILGEGQW